MALNRAGRRAFRPRGASRGASRGRGRVNGGGAARSGIRSRGGHYSKFDSQRVREVEASESEHEQQGRDLTDGGDDGSDLGEDGEDGRKVRAYDALLDLFQKTEPRRKRRKLDVEQAREEAADELSLDFEGDVGAEGGVEAEADSSDPDDEEVAQQSINGDNLHPDGLDDEQDASDPFEVHFANPDSDSLASCVKAVQANEWQRAKQEVANIGIIAVSAPASTKGNILRKPNLKGANEISLKKRLAETAAKHLLEFDTLQRSIAPYLVNYTDLIIGNRKPRNAESLRCLACLHALNHVLKGRDKVLKNTARLAAAEDSGALDLRDQGFTRPKILLLTETRQHAAKYADTIVQLFAPEQQENRSRFYDSFTAEVDDASSMPEDYRDLFGGNNDNNFLTAIKFTRKTLKFYSAFYTSDIILASPLGLRRIIEHEDHRKQDSDFLSSIELVVVDQADAMQMQSWQNVDVVFDHLNLQPKHLHGADVSRIRQLYLDGQAKYFRQTLIFSAYITPEINALANKHLLNVAGKAKLSPTYAGAITTLGSLGVKQTFSRFPSTVPTSDPDDRFKYFTTAVLPSLLRLPKPADGAQGILVFIPSYYDFLRLRNHFATSMQTQNTGFGAIHDYSEVSEQRRARSHFLSGRHSVLLYTQRAHHFFRLRIKGVKRAVLYGLPDNPIFYEELVGGMLGGSVDEGRVHVEECGVRVLFSRWDGLRLERVVGSGRVKGMLAGQGDTFAFV